MTVAGTRSFILGTETEQYFGFVGLYFVRIVYKTISNYK